MVRHAGGGHEALDLDDHATFAGLYDAHADRIYRFCFRRTADASTAEDLMAATFLHAWRGRKRAVVTESSAAGWLLGIALNLTRNTWRSSRRLRHALERMPPPAPTADHAEEVVARLEDQQRMRDVLRVWGRLTDLEQDALALVTWGDLSHEEASEILGIAPGTLRSRLHRARQRLSDELGEEGAT